MRPSVAGYLVTVADHASDESRPWQVWVVDGSFAEVSSSDVKGCLGVVFLDLLGVDGLWKGYSPGEDRGGLLCT